MEGLVMFRELENTYGNKKVFLTGHTGFKGSWMLAVFKMLKARVKGYALAPEKDLSLYNLLNGDDLCQSVIADVRDAERLTEELTNFQPDFVFHLAAQPLVRRSYSHPVETFEVNVMGTLNLLEALRKLEKPCTAVIITTDKVYENKEKDYAYKEDDKLGGYDPYSASKACVEVVAASYRCSFFSPDEYQKHRKAIATARSGNVIGGGDWAEDRIMPDLARAMAAGKPVKVRNPHSVRPWQHMLEPLCGYLTLGCRLQQDPIRYSGSYNFGPETSDELSVEALVKTAIKCWGNGSYTVNENTGDPHEAGMLKLNITKVKKQLQWSPKMRSVQAIDKTVKWYKNYESGALTYTQKQIREYFDLP